MWSSYVPAGYEDPDELKASDSSGDVPAGYEDPDEPPKPVRPPGLLARIGRTISDAVPAPGSMHDPHAPPGYEAAERGGSSVAPADERYTYETLKSPAKTVEEDGYTYEQLPAEEKPQKPLFAGRDVGDEGPMKPLGAMDYLFHQNLSNAPASAAAPPVGEPDADHFADETQGYTYENLAEPVRPGVPLFRGQPMGKVPQTTGQPNLTTGQAIQQLMAGGTAAGEVETALPTGQVKPGVDLYAGKNQAPVTTSGGPQTLEEGAARLAETQLPTGEVRPGTTLYGGGTRNQPVNQAPTTTPGGGAAIAAGAAQGLAGLGDTLASPEALGLLVGIPAVASLLPARVAAILNAAATGKFGFDIGHGIATEQAAQLGDAIGSKDPQKIAAALTGIAGSFLMLLHPAKERPEEAAARAAKEPPALGPLTNEVGDHFMHLGKEGIEPSAGATGPFEVPADIKREWTLGGLVPDALKQGEAAAAAISARADELEAQFQKENHAKKGPLIEQARLRNEPAAREEFEEAAKQEIQDEKAAVAPRHPDEGTHEAEGLGRPADQEHGEAVNAGGGIPEHGLAPEDAGAAERAAGGRGERGGEAPAELTARDRAAEVLSGVKSKLWTVRQKALRDAGFSREEAKAHEQDLRGAAAPTPTSGGITPPLTEATTPLLTKVLGEKKAKKMTGADIEARRAAYFTPGNIVEAYGGAKDKVIAYQPATEENGLNWSVDVQGLDKAGDPEGPIRRHATEPEWKQTRRVASKGEEPAAAEKQPWQMTPAEWDAEFEQTRANAQGTGGDTKYGGMGRSTTEKGLGDRVNAAQSRQDFLKMGLPDEDVEGLPVPARHFQVVREALRRGLPVPKGVLDEYPELSQKTATSAADSLREGKEGRLTMEDGEKVPFRFGVIEAGDLITSHNDDLSVNPRARTELQGRDRSKGISRLQVSTIEKNPDFDRLEAAPTPDVGAPIVNRMGEALGGQGRTIGLRRAYRKGNADEYRRQLEARAADYGLDPKDFADMKHPVLVRVTGDVKDEAAFAEKTNVSAGLSLSASEKGRQDAKKLTPAVLDIADPEADLAAPRNAAFVGRFINELVPKNERGPLLDEKTGISPEGVQRVRAALIASAYGDTPPARRLLEELPEDTRAIQKALVDAAPAIASAQVAMKAGDVQQVDFTGPILEAADLLHKMALDGTALKQFLEPKYGELLSVERGPETDRLLTFFEANKRKPKEIVRFLRALADTVQTFETSKTESLFGDELKGEPPTQAEIYEIARRTYDEVSHEQTALFAEEPEPANPRGPSTEGGSARGGADQEPLPERGEHPAERGIQEAGLELPEAADREPGGDQRGTLTAGAEAGVPGRADRTLPSEGDVAAERHIAGGPPLGPQQSLGAGAPGDLDSAPMGARLTAAMQALSGKATGPEKVYSRLGHAKDVAGGYGLNQLAEAAPDVSTMARKASSAQAKAHALIRETLPKLADALGDGKKSVEKFFAALADNRLRGIVDKYDAMKNEAAAMDADNLLSNGDRWHSFLDAVEGRRGFEDADLLGPFEQAMDRGDAEAVRRLVIDTADKASDEVGQVHLGDDDTFEKHTKTPEFKEALKVYKDDLETTLRNAHALNDGYFTEHLGPLGTYFPLSSINEQQNVGAPRRPAFKKPPNPNNPFATGLGEYDTSVEAFHKNLARALRQNGRAAVIESARDAGILTQLKAGMPAPPTVLYEGREFTAKTVETGTRMLVNKDGRVARIPSPKGVLPGWAYEELKPILEPDLKTEEVAWKKLASAATVFNMGGPTDAVYHSLNLYGTLMLRTPFVGTDLMSKIASNVPTPLNLGRALAGLVNIINTKPASLENARRFREMVENGQIPSRYGTATYSKAYSKLTGAEYGGLRLPWHTNEGGKLRPRLPIDFGPLIFGPNGIDVRARILLDKIGEHIANESGHEWTPEERFNWGRQMGNYVKETEGRIERAAKGSALAPFYTAGRQMNWNAFSGMLGAGHLPLGEGKSQVANKYRAMMVMNGVVGSVTTWALMNYAYRGVWPWDDKESRLGQIALNPEDRKSGLARKIYGDDTTKTAWVNAWALNPLLSRGLRITGAKALLEGAITKVPFDKRVDQAEVDMLNGFAHPFLGPPTHLLTRSAFGVEPYVQSLQERSRPAVRFKSAFHDYVEPGLAGIGQRLVSGLEGANPITRRILDARTQGQPAARVAFDTFLPNLFKGPYRTNSPLERELMDITLANAPAPSKERLEKVKLLRQLDNARGAEDQSQYSTLLSSLKSKYGMTERDTRKIDAHPEHVIENQFKALSLPEAVRVFKTGTDDQQKTLRILLQRKLMGMAGMKDLEPDARADVIKEARQLLNREPSKYAEASR